MSRRSDLLYLGHMLDAARRAQQRAAHLSREQFDADEDIQIVLMHYVRVIGEAARKLPEESRVAHPEIPWTEIMGMRHKLVHDYMGVNLDVVWKTVTQHLPPLIAALEKITPPEPPSA